MKKLLLFGFSLFALSLNAQEWIISHTNEPYTARPTGNIPIGDQYGMAIKGNTVCYAGGSGGWITTDMGANWSKVVEAGNYMVNAIAIHPSLNEIFFARNSYTDTCKILKTVDYGANFKVVHKNKGKNYSEIVVTKQGTILAFTISNSTSTMYRSTDGGENWTETTLSYYSAAQVKVYGDTILMAGKGDYGGFYYSVDDGVTFNKKNILTSSSRNTHSICKAKNGDIFIGGYPAYPSSSTNGEIYKSTDFGDNWTLVYTASNSYTPIYDIEALPDGNLYACTILRGTLMSNNGGDSWSKIKDEGGMELGVGDNGKLYCVVNGWLVYLGATNTSINKNPYVSQINFYPNPTTDQINITNITQPTDYQIFDITGKLVQKSITTGIIDMQKLAKGIYFVKINRNMLKIIKE